MAQYHRANQFNRTVGTAMVCIVSISGAFGHRKESEHSRASMVWAPPPSLIPESLDLEPSVRKALLTQLRVADLGIVLEQTPIQKAQERFGGKLGHSGDAGDSLTWLCLRGSDKRGPWALWLESGEMDGGTISGLQWQRTEAAEKFSHGCPVLTTRDSTVELPVMIRLGTKEANVLQALGQPTTRHGDIFVYYHSHEVSIKGESYTVVSTLAIQIRGGVVQAIQADQNTSS
jgi:hypothetical protein